MTKHLNKMFSVFTILALMMMALPMQSAQAVSPNIVISQVYGGGGNAGATLRNDFIELFNRGTTSVSVNGWSVQYAATSGTSWQKTDLPNVTLAPGQYLLVQEAQGAGGTTNLPTPDATGTIAMSSTAGKVALVNNNTLITLGTGCPSGATIIDFLGYGPGTNCSETSPTTSNLSNTTAALRGANGCTETDNNSTDFSNGTPNPRNTASPLSPCPTGVTLSISDVSADEGNLGTTTFSFTVSLSGPAGAGGVTFDIATQDNTAADADNDYEPNALTGQSITAGNMTYTFDVTVNGDTTSEANETFFVNVTNVTGATITDGQGTGTIVNDDVTLTPIHDIQGAAHISPFVTTVNDNSISFSATAVNVLGIVTVRTSNGFYMQDPNPDNDPATSEGIFVFTGTSGSKPNVGDSVRVSGAVGEIRPGCTSNTCTNTSSAWNNLTVTELTANNAGGVPLVWTLVSPGNTPPSPQVIGTGGRVPPSQVIEDDTTGSIETTPNTFDPDTDGIDFYESLEGMLVQVNNPVVIGPRNDFGEIFVLADSGANASVRTARGGIIVRPNDFNPERIQFDDNFVNTPVVNVGDQFSGSAVGVVDYNFGNFEVLPTQSLPPVSGNLAKETTAAPAAHQLSTATFNVENLNPNDDPAKFNELAELIVNNLEAPDIIAIEEVQDNNGAPGGNAQCPAVADGVVDASQTWNTLITAIQNAQGPIYDYRQIDPVDCQDGGAPGGNIRVGFLFRTDRGVAFVDRPGATSTTANSVTGSGASTQLQFSPGRIDPTNSAFNASRKPLAGEFTFHGDKVFLIANHFNSKGGDQPLFGRFQPPTLVTEAQRIQQAQVVKSFVDSILAADPNANIVVLGDLNDFEFSPPLAILEGNELNTLIETLPQNERYTYVFEGNSQTLDHILISDSIFNRPFAYDVVHVNSEFAEQASDHEPQVALLCVDATAPSLTVTVSPNSLWPPNHSYVTVNATVTASDNADPSPLLTLVSVTSNEPDNGDDDGNTINDIVIVDDDTFQLRAERSGVGTGRIYTITYQLADACGNVTTQTATVTVPLTQ